MKRALQTLVIIAFAFILFQPTQVKAQKPMHELHSMLIFNFVKYVEWPDEAKSGDFVIAVYGDDKVFDQLNALYGGKTHKGQPVKLVNASSVGQLNNAHLVYLADNKSGDFDAVLSQTTGKPTLLITDKNNLGEQGANINFKVVGGKLKFEINEAAFSKNNLKVSSSLLSMAIVI